MSRLKSFAEYCPFRVIDLLVRILSLLFLLTGASEILSQQILTSINLSPEFQNIAGTPRLTRNTNSNVWLVVWRQNGSPSKIMGRIIKADGSIQPSKVIISNVHSSEYGFDVAYDPVTNRYLLVFLNDTSLRSQLLSPSLSKLGKSSIVDSGTNHAFPRLVYDSLDRNFFLYWISSLDGSPGKLLKHREIDSTAVPQGNTVILTTAATGKFFSSLQLSRSSKSGRSLAMMLQQSTIFGGAVLGFQIDLQGQLPRKSPVVIKPSTPGLISIGSSDFSDAGIGFAMFAEASSIKYRKISGAVTLASPIRTIAGIADSNSQHPGIVYDSRNHQFVGVWAAQNEIRAAAWNPSSGALSKSTFPVTVSNLGHSRNVVCSFDPEQANVFAVWEDSTADVPQNGQRVKFQIRAALFSLASSDTRATVSIGDNFFNPPNLTISRGTTVDWTNNGNLPHTATSGTPTSMTGAVFDSPTLNRGNVFSFRFSEAGTFQYFCRVHGSRQSGTITVNP